MDNQYLYNEAMAKLAEAQTCQNEAAKYHDELLKIQAVIRNTFDYKIRTSLSRQCNDLISYKNERIKERDDKLNEAISKALELIDDEISNNVLPKNSLGLQAAGTIYGYVNSQNIQLQFSVEVMAKKAKIAKVTAKELNDLLTLLNTFGW